MNARYLAYAAAHGLDPEAQIVADRQRWPGGSMCGFILWIGERWREWALETGHPRARIGADAYLSPEDHASFDAWLQSCARNP